MKQNPKILVAMSGGVDSSVAAALLASQGYDVTGAFMVNYDENKGTEKCWTNDYQDALRVAAKLGIKLLRLDFIKEYKKTVLDYMYKEYAAGRTPNPDILCNKFIKFGAWLDKAKELGFDYLATGHYAQISPKFIKSKVHKVRLLQAKDEDKDQTYFLHQLNQEQLRHVLFPIGDYTKPEVRKLAKKFGLPTAEKEESMGICFVGEVPMKEFLMKKIKPKKGKILDTNGNVLGHHEGVPFYTVGERVGLSFRIPTKLGEESLSGKIGQIFLTEFTLSASECVRDDNTKPLYVVDKNLKKNILVVGYENDPLLYKKEIEVKDVNWISGRAPKFPLKREVRLRHRQPLQKSKVKSLKSKVLVEFDSFQRAVTPGQFAVFYKNGECLGGGVIQ